MSEVTLGWMWLLGGVALSVIGSPLLKMSNGFERPVMGAIGLLLCLGTIGCWAFVVKYLPLGLSYVVWSGLSVIGMITFGMLFFGETITALKAIFMAMVLIGCIGLRVITK